MADGSPPWIGWIRDLGMFVIGAVLLVNESVFRAGDPRWGLVWMDGALMAGPVFLQSFLAAKK